MNYKVIYAAIAGVCGVLWAGGIIPVLAFGGLVFASLMALNA